MDAIIDGDIASTRWADWHTIPWAMAFQSVRRLQIRIAKAAKDEDWRRVRFLQRLLVRSTTAKAVAVRRVTENQGRKTSGVDGVTWSTSTEKGRAIAELETRRYRPKPLRRVHIPKANGGKRPLGIPTMKDRAMQALYWLALDPVAETRGDLNSYDPKDETYFDVRMTRRMGSSLQGRRKLFWLWNQQEGLCPVCASKITKATGWHVHHMVWRVFGGSDRLSNLQLLHPTCHMQLHARAAKE